MTDERVVGRAQAERAARTRWHLDLMAPRPAGSNSLDVLPAPYRVLVEGDVLVRGGAGARLAVFTR